MEMVYFFQMVERDSAAFYAEKAVELAPTWIRPYSNLAYFYTTGFNCSGNGLEKAKYYLKLADKVDSTASQSNYLHIKNWASYYYRSGQLDKAISAYEKAIAIDSSKVSAQSNLGNVYVSQENFAGAEAQYKKAIELDPTNRIISSNLGIVYFRTDRFEEAEEQFNNSFKLDSTFVQTLRWLGNLYSMTNRIEEGEKFYKKIIELDTISIMNIMTIAQYYTKINQYEKSEKYYKKTIQLDSTLWPAYSNLGGVYRLMDKLDKAIEMAKKAIALGPPIPQLYINIGKIYMQNMEDFKDAETAFSKALEMNPNNPKIYFSLSQFALKKKQQEAAWEYLDQAFEKDIGHRKVLPITIFDGLPDFEELKKEKTRWDEFMNKFFPYQGKE